MRGVRLHVAREADLEGDARVVHLGGERRVLEQSRGVADARGAAGVDRLPDRPRAVPLTRMAGAGEAVRLRVAERLGMVGGRVADLPSREVETDDPLVLVVDREAREVERRRRRQVPQRADEHSGDDVVVALGLGQSAQRGLHRFA